MGLIAALAFLVQQLALADDANQPAPSPDVIDTSVWPGSDEASADTLACFSAEQKPNFTLFSLGNAFDGLPLTAILRQCDRPRSDEFRGNSVSYIYGTCEAGDGFGCPPPVEIQVWPSCERTFSDYDLGAFDANPELEAARGVPAGRVLDRFELYSADSTIVIFADTDARVDLAVDQLVASPDPSLSATDVPSAVDEGAASSGRDLEEPIAGLDPLSKQVAPCTP